MGFILTVLKWSVLWFSLNVPYVLFPTVLDHGVSSVFAYAWCAWERCTFVGQFVSIFMRVSSN